MKTQTFLFTVLSLCWCGISNGQFYDDFESYTPGEPINKNWWDHGSCDGGPGCDLMASDAVVHSGEVAGFVPGDTTTDASLDLGNKIFGIWDFQFYLYIPSEKDGFLALMDVVPITSGIPIMGYFSFNPNLSTPGVGTISDSPLGPLNFTFPHEEWFLFEMYVDITLGIANATCMLAIDGEEILPSGTPFTDSNGTIPVSLGGIEFFSISNQNEFYIDNVCYRSFGKGDCFLGMEEYTNNFDLEIIPNPVKNLFSIQSQDTIVNIQLFNSLGQFIGELPVADQYDLSRFPAGVYLLLVKTERGVIVQKLIK